MNDQNNIAYRLASLAALLQSTVKLSMWCFDTDGHLYYTTSPYSRELSIFLEIGGCKDYAMTEGAALNIPFVMSDAMGLIWVGEYLNVTDDIGRVLVLLGPLFHSDISMQTIEEKMRQRNIPLSMRSMGRQILTDIPVISFADLDRYIIMLHWSGTNTLIERNNIFYQINMKEGELEVTGAPIIREKHFLDYESAYARELLIMQCIRDGNLDYKNVLGEYRSSSIPDNYMTGDPLREAKNTIIIFIARCTQSAIEGKLSIKAAKEIEISAIRRLERCQTITDITNLRVQVMEEYIRRVHALHVRPGISQSIQICCDYIQAHLMDPFTLADVAKATGYTEYYLTRKFQKEMGVKLSDYIRKLRLDHAKIWLISTETSIQEISAKLQFGTRNHFTRVFKEQEGVSPIEFRERARNMSRN